MDTLLEKILKELRYELKDYQTPSTYQDAEYYVVCKAKAEAYEEAIDRIERLVKESLVPHPDNAQIMKHLPFINDATIKIEHLIKAKPMPRRIDIACVLEELLINVHKNK